jgi:hypothetical protein
MRSGPLSQSKINAMNQSEKEIVDASYLLRSETYKIVKKDIEAEMSSIADYRIRCAKIAYELIHKNKHSIKTVANIGARVDSINDFLSQEFPNIEFISIDFQDNLETHNSLFTTRDNWKMLSGYAYSLIKEGDVKADFIFMNATSSLFNTKELDSYIEEMAKNTKFLFFCRNWWPKNKELIPGRVIPPEDIPIEAGFCAGSYSEYHNNYIGILEKYGYTVISSQIIPTPGKTSFNLQVLAEHAD